MGSFLLPPNHPGLTNGVETDITRKKENRGSMSLEYCAGTESYCDEVTKKQARQLIKEWEESKLPLDSEEVQKWLVACKNHLGNGGHLIDYVIKYYPEFRNATV